MQRNERFDSADRIVRIGFWVNAVLMVFKMAAGYWGHSEAVFADGIESACDFVAIFSTMVALKLGRKPFDEKHPYGHGRAESLSALLVSLVILATGGWILSTSIHYDHRPADFSPPRLIAVVAAFLTIIIKEWLYRFTQKTGAQAGESVTAGHCQGSSQGRHYLDFDPGRRQRRLFRIRHHGSAGGRADVVLHPAYRLPDLPGCCP